MDIQNVKLSSGKELEIIYKGWKAPNPLPVTFDGEEVEDGFYFKEDSNRKFIVKNSKIVKFYWCFNYNLTNGMKITIDQKSPYKYQEGDVVWEIANNKRIEDGKFKIVGGKTIICKNGILAKKSWF